MKKIISSILFVFLFPFKSFARIGKNSFVMGLIFGAVFSLIVNILTVQVQEMIQKQRILEAIENEIVSNMLLANGVIDGAINTRKNKQQFNYFYIFKKYSRDLWGQSTEPLQYVAQLDQETQININNYYSFTIPYQNAQQDKMIALFESEMKDCPFFDNNLPVKKMNECNEKYYSLLNIEAKYNASDVSKRSFEVLKIFHPTKDRLNDPILKILMGDKSMRILSGK